MLIITCSYLIMVYIYVCVYIKGKGVTVLVYYKQKVIIIEEGHIEINEEIMLYKVVILMVVNMTEADEDVLIYFYLYTINYYNEKTSL